MTPQDGETAQEGHVPWLDPDYLLAHATEFVFTPSGGPTDDLDEMTEQVEVVWRSQGRWAVKRRSRVLNHDGEWEWEPTPSSRDDAFFERCRWDFDEAIEAAIVAVATGGGGGA